MTKPLIPALAALGLLGASFAHAQSDYVETTYTGDSESRSLFDNRWYIAPFASYTWPDEDRGTDDGWGGGVSVGKPLNQWLNLELRTMYSELGRDNGQGDFNIWDIGVDGLVFFRREGFQPFLLAGIGTTYDEFSCDSTLKANGLCSREGSEWSSMANAGAGFLVPITDRVLLRADGAATATRQIREVSTMQTISGTGSSPLASRSRWVHWLVP